jgi:hypothetical protein
VNGEIVTDLNATIKPDVLPVILQVGKRKFVRLVSPGQDSARSA